jgi:hypothetical protein
MTRSDSAGELVVVALGRSATRSGPDSGRITDYPEVERVTHCSVCNFRIADKPPTIQVALAIAMSIPHARSFSPMCGLHLQYISLCYRAALFGSNGGGATVNFRLIDSRWDKVLDEALKVNHASIRIVCPFIKRGVANRLLKYGKPKLVQVITRFSLRDFAAGVSDVSALRLLLENGAQVKGVRNLHAKLYLFGESRAIVTSANLTEAALLTNHELGFVATDAWIIDPCRQYFEKLWSRAGQRLQVAKLADWDRKIAKSAGGMRQGAATDLDDEGTDVGIPSESVILPPWVDRVEQSFVKFFGRGDNRADRSMQILEEVRRSGSHWACTYPKGKRPRMVQDGATMFMGRLVKEPNDTLVYGRAMAIHHEPGRDDATAADLRLRGWKAKWPHYVRVDNSEFVRGNLANGVSLNELMDVLKADSFASTQRHARKGEGNRDPRRAYMRKAAVELSPQGAAWLNERLEGAFAKHGRLPPSALEQLDWPLVRSLTGRSAK